MRLFGLHKHRAFTAGHSCNARVGAEVSHGGVVRRTPQAGFLCVALALALLLTGATPLFSQAAQSSNDRSSLTVVSYVPGSWAFNLSVSGGGQLVLKSIADNPQAPPAPPAAPGAEPVSQRLVGQLGWAQPTFAAYGNPYAQPAVAGQLGGALQPAAMGQGNPYALDVVAPEVSSAWVGDVGVAPTFKPAATNTDAPVLVALTSQAGLDPSTVKPAKPGFTLRDGSAILGVQRATLLTFDLQADKGAQIKSITLNGKDVSNMVGSNQVLTLPSEQSEGNLDISFTAAKPAAPEGGAGQTGGHGILGGFLQQTGDPLVQAILLVTLLVAVGALALVVTRRRKKAANGKENL